MYIVKLIFWSIPSWQRVPNPPLLWRSPYITYPRPPPPNPFFKFCFISLNEWVVAPHLMCYLLCYVLLHCIMDLHMLSLGTLVPQGPCGVFYGTRCQVYWALRHDRIFCCYSDLISQSTHGGQDWHIHINIY